DEDGYSDQERVFQPSRFEREAEEPLQPDVDGPRETKDEHDERKQRRRPAEHLPGQETPNGLDVRLVELEQLRRTRGQGRRLAHRFPFSHPVNLPERGGLGSEQAHAAMFRALPSAPGTPSAADPPAPAATTRADTTSTTGFPASRACDRLRRRPRSHAQKLPCSRAKSSLFLRKSSLFHVTRSLFFERKSRSAAALGRRPRRAGAAVAPRRRRVRCARSWRRGAGTRPLNAF